jgi:uncharacterized membrane protein
MRAYYYEHHRLLQGLLALSVVLSSLAGMLLLNRLSMEPWLAARLAAFVVLVPGIVSRRPWVHATQVVVLMLLFSFALTEIGRPISE